MKRLLAQNGVRLDKTPFSPKKRSSGLLRMRSLAHTLQKMAHERAVERLENPKIRWYFTKEEVMNSPSRADGVDPDKELSYRQQAANMIQDMGQRLNV